MKRGGESVAVEKIEQTNSAKIFSGTARRAGLRLVEEFPAGRRNLFAHAELLEDLVDGFRTGTAAGEGEQGIGRLLQADRNGIEGLTGGEGFDALPQAAAGGGDALQLPGIGDNGRSGIEVGKADHLPDGFGELREAGTGGGADGNRSRRHGGYGRFFLLGEDGREILFIIDGNGGATRKLREPFAFFGGEGAAFIKDRQNEVALFQRAAAALHPDLFDGISPSAFPIPPACGKAMIPQADGFLNNIPGGAGDVGDNAAFPTGEEIHQGGFTDIGAADDGGGDALPHHLPLLPAMLQAEKGGLYPI